MSPSQPAEPAEGGPPAPAGRSRRYRFLLLGYVLGTLLLFALVYRYMQQVAALYNYEIESDLIQWTLYVGIFSLVSIAAYELSRRLPLPLRPENHLRLTVLGALTVALVVAIYQSRYGVTPFAKLVKLVNFFGFGALASFGVVLWITRRRFGLVEVIAQPEPEVVEAVRRKHAGIVLAAGLRDRGKRLVEWLLTLVIIVVSLPLASLLAIAVWLQDPGPLLVAKVVVGRGGRSFNQFKLRTMIKDAEGDTGPVPAAPTDARVTRLGYLLRRTHIDELPQMLNILRGDMSLVGPRPERTVFVQRHLAQIQGYALRHAVRPGLAGMAQVFGDYYSTPREKLRYDLLYIRRRSLVLDLKLFLAAVGLALFGLSPRRPGRGRARHRREEQRWRRAYHALRGEGLPESAGEGSAPGEPDEPSAAGIGENGA